MLSANDCCRRCAIGYLRIAECSRESVLTSKDAGSELRVEFPDSLPRPYSELRRKGCEPVAARFNDAVQWAEQVLIDALSQFAAHVNDRPTGQCDGKLKVFWRELHPHDDW